MQPITAALFRWFSVTATLTPLSTLAPVGNGARHFMLKTQTMDDRNPHTSGQVLAQQNEAGVAAILNVSFPQTQVRESSHYTTGRYVRIDFPSGVEFFFERISEEEFLIRGEGEDSQLLSNAAEEIANCFGTHGLRCRFETYAEDGDFLFAYSHYDWPVQDIPQTD